MLTFANHHKLTGWSQLGFTLVLVTSGLLNTVIASEPRTPDSGEEILETLPTLSTQDSTRLKLLRQKLNSSPDNISLSTQLATLYINTARTNSDARYYGYAQAVLKPWWDKNSPPTDILFLRATLQQHHHQYRQAISDLKQLLKHQPRHAQAWLTLSTIQQVQGDYVSASTGCSALARTASAWLSSLCHSQIWSLTGSADRAYKLQQALAIQVSSNPKLLKWVLGLSAETALRLGNRDQAEKHFNIARALPIRDAYLLRVYSDFLLTENRPEKVLTLLKDETQDDALLLRLAIAAKQGNKISLQKRYQKLLQSRYKAARLRGSKLHERDEALYLLEFSKNKKKALKLALDNWGIQREPDDVLILLRAAIANNSTSEIQMVREWVKQNKLQDIRLTTLLNQPQGEE